MKKISLLAASVAVALAGCGSDDSGSSTGGSAGATITAFDGYFKNAVVFVDKNNNGVWDNADGDFFRLTDGNGQVDIGDTIVEIGQSLAVQTITPGGTAQARLLSISAQEYAGIYTVDMDLPGQPMEHEVVFRAPSSSDVISPITDLVAIEMQDGTNQEEAEAEVKESLGVTDTNDLYSDFVSGEEADPVLHKTAQILTETKATNSSYEQEIKDGSSDFAKDAKQVADGLSDEELEDPTYVAPVDGNTNTPETPDYKTMVNADVYNAIKAEFDSLDLALGDEGDGGFIFEVNIDGLFLDKDVTGGIELIYNTSNPTDSNNTISLDKSTELAGSKIHVDIYDNYRGTENTVLVFGIEGNGTKVAKAGDFEVTIKLKDGTDYNATDAKFSFSVSEGDALPPVIDASQVDVLQGFANDWTFTEDTEVTDNDGYVINFTDVFTNASDGSTAYLTLEASSNAILNGLNINDDGFGNVTVTGTPKNAADYGDYTIQLTATDINGLSSTASIKLPEVTARDLHVLEGKTWYFLEHGSSSSDDSDTKEYARVWCDSVRLEDGIVKYNKRSLANNTECSEPTNTEEQSTYVINDAGDVEVTYTWVENGVEKEETYTATLADLTGADLIPDTQTIVTEYDDAESGINGIKERYVYFSNKADAEARLNVQSDDGPEIGERAFAFNYPHLETETDLTWNLGMVTIALSNERDHDGESETYSDADIYFDDPNQNIDCAYLNEFFTSFVITGEAIDEPNKGGDSSHIIYSSGSPYGFECYTKQDDDSDVTHASIDFDIPHKLEEGAIYNLIGYARRANNSDGELRNNGEYIESVTFNIEWTGAANND